MRIIISPAKKMREDSDSLPSESEPRFLPEAQQLLDRLRELDAVRLKALWGCNEAIAALNRERVRTMDLRAGLTPALLAYEGIQFQYMAPGVFTDQQFAYVREHLRILSGFYGMLRPFDGVTPYRLEMRAKLAVDGQKDLYGFWGDKLARQLGAETDWILNLASYEYSRAVSAHLPGTVRFLSCTFGELNQGRVLEKGTLCKMARGEMVRWLAEHQTTDPEDVKQFCHLGYAYSKAHSTDDRLVFLRDNAGRADRR